MSKATDEREIRIAYNDAGHEMERRAIIELIERLDCPSGYRGSSFEAGWNEALRVLRARIEEKS